MTKTKPHCPAEFRRQLVELVQVGRAPAELPREFGCSAQTIIHWVARAAVESSKPLPGTDLPRTGERKESVPSQNFSGGKVALGRITKWGRRLSSDAADPERQVSRDDVAKAQGPHLPWLVQLTCSKVWSVTIRRKAQTRFAKFRRMAAVTSRA